LPKLHDALAAAVFDRPAFYALAAHIQVEEMELFPAAMLGFDDEEWGRGRCAPSRRPAP
jgi:hypothetical protein